MEVKILTRKCPFCDFKSHHPYHVDVDGELEKAQAILKEIIDEHVKKNH